MSGTYQYQCLLYTAQHRVWVVRGPEAERELLGGGGRSGKRKEPQEEAQLLRKLKRSRPKSLVRSIAVQESGIKDFELNTEGGEPKAKEAI